MGVGEYTDVVSLVFPSSKERLWSVSVDSYPISLAFSPDGHLLAVATCESFVYAIDTLTGTIVQRFGGFESQVRQVGFSFDGRVLAIASETLLEARDTTQWDVVCRAKELPGLIYSISMCPRDDRLAVGFDDGAIEIWTLEGLGMLLRLLGHDDFIYSLDWSLDGRFLASGGDDGTVRIWTLAEAT
ncbi:MAG TPA: hypothetical protein VNK04_03155 [Gemmataceae bacterium]|nr:hypothetical protein [Gemmataceae bacterium]